MVSKGHKSSGYCENYVTAFAPEGYQSENVLFDGGSLEVIGNFQDDIRRTSLLIEELLSVGESILFGNIGEFVSVRHIHRLDHSLTFIKPANIDVYLTKNWRGKVQTRAKFDFNGNSYNLPITDIDFENRFRKNSMLLDSWTHVYFTVSLGVEFNLKHYKLIAGVIYLK